MRNSGDRHRDKSARENAVDSGTCPCINRGVRTLARARNYGPAAPLGSHWREMGVVGIDRGRAESTRVIGGNRARSRRRLNP